MADRHGGKCQNKGAKCVETEIVEFQGFSDPGRDRRADTDYDRCQKVSQGTSEHGGKKRRNPYVPQSPVSVQSYWTAFGDWISFSCFSASSTVIFPSQKWRDTSFT